MRNSAIRLNCTDPEGVNHELAATEGASVMEVVTRSGVEGIVAECGGFMSCATCHVYVDPEWIDVVETAEAKDDDTEAELLEGTMAERRPESRLSCQIKITTDLDGLHVTIPKEQ